MNNANPLLDYPGLPPFSQIKPEHVRDALKQVLDDNRARIQALIGQGSGAAHTWDQLIEPLAELEDRLERMWSPVRHMHSVVDSPELREAYNAGLEELTEYSTDLGQNRELYEAFLSLDKQALDAGQKKVVNDAIRDFKLSGIGLIGDDRDKYKQIQAELSQLQSKFEQNLLDATLAWTRHFETVESLKGLPPSALAAAKARAESHGLGGYELSLQSPDYIAVMTYADDRALRRQMHEAYQTRASDRGPHAGKFDNSVIMDRILELRHAKAKLLGFANYAQKSLAAKMANKPDEVLGFLKELAQKARPHAEQEWAELQEFARTRLTLTDLAPHDVAYVSEKLKQERYSLSREDLKPYLPVDSVLAGLFKLIEKLYGMHVDEEPGVDVWHPAVRFFRISDRKGQVRGHFYLDLYAREHKRGGAWMDECFGRWRTRSGLRTPVAYLTCNAASPASGMPALFTHDEVVTLFHEFGHGLHHMLTLVDYPQISGIRGVEWDAVELPSQFMENWCWTDEVLDMMARHHETGEPIPAELKQRLMASKNFMSGLGTLRQLEFALFDFRMHLEYDPAKGGRVQQILDEVRREVAIIPPPEYVRFQHSFSHIFAGGYAAGYYSYKWAEVLSADAFAAFEEEGLFKGSAGRRFLKNILEKGGSKPAMALYKSFRKRKPTVDALLRHSGLAA